MFAVQATNGKFYTGKAGEGWLSDNKADAFGYSFDGAANVAARFNSNNGPLCGLTFRSVFLGRFE
jgi:hypothetical protein